MRSKVVTDRVRLWLPVLAALAVRLVVVLLNYRETPDAELNFERFGWEMGWVARSLAQGHGFSSPFLPFSGPTALVPPLYPSVLASVFHLFGVYTVTSAFVILALNSLFSSLICVTLYFIAKPYLGVRYAYIAAWVWAFHPYAIYFSANRVWDYALAGLLLSLCVCMAQRLHRWLAGAWWVFGLIYGLTALSNPAVLSTFPFLLGFALYKRRKFTPQSRSSWWLASLAVMGLAMMIAPWTVRNARVMHILCPIRDNFWLELWYGNTGDTSDPMPAWTHPASSASEMGTYLALGEKRYIEQKREFAIHALSQHPVFFVAQTLRRIGFFWTGFWSLSSEYLRREPFAVPNFLFCGTLFILTLRGLLRLLRIDRVAALPLFALVAVFPMTYYVSHPLTDYRQPIEPEIVVLLVAAFLPSVSRPQRSLSTPAPSQMEEYSVQ